MDSKILQKFEKNLKDAIIQMRKSLTRPGSKGELKKEDSKNSAPLRFLSKKVDVTNSLINYYFNSLKNPKMCFVVSAQFKDDNPKLSTFCLDLKNGKTELIQENCDDFTDAAMSIKDYIKRMKYE